MSTFRVLRPVSLNSDRDMDSFHIDIDGMSCSHCVARVEQSLRSVAGVTEVRVEIGHAEVTASGIAREPLDAAIREAGFTPRPG